MFAFDDDGTERRFWVSLYLNDTGETEEEIVDALVELRPMDELLAALQLDDPVVRQRATEMFWRLSLSEAGELAQDEALRGLELMSQGQSEAAIECFTQLLDSFPAFSEARNKRAAAYYLKGDYTAAIEDCRTVLDTKPSHFGSWRQLGMCYLRMEGYESASDAFRSALRIQPYSEDVARLLAYCRGRLVAPRRSATPPPSP